MATVLENLQTSQSNLAKKIAEATDLDAVNAADAARQKAASEGGSPDGAAETGSDSAGTGGEVSDTGDSQA